MLKNRGIRATSNLAMLERVARRLGDLNEQVVYLGGCATALFITDPLSLDVRSTMDVDCIIDVLSLGQYHKFEKELSRKGFKKSMEDDVICRWHYEDIILDVMPTDTKILGFGNQWYKEAVTHAIDYDYASDLMLRSITCPYFLATKIEAFKQRGNNDFLGSHDFEDIVTVIAGSLEVIDEIRLANQKLRNHLGVTFGDILNDEQFHLALPGHLNDGPVTMERVRIVLQKIQKIADMASE